MNQFQEIMRLMNNGLNNTSTLRHVVPKIVSLGLEKNPNDIDKVAIWMMSEKELNKPHPGLDRVNMVCSTMISEYTMAKEQSKTL